MPGSFLKVRETVTAVPRVAVVIPTYNHAAFLRGALDSVLTQTVSDWEAIVVNNFSEDDTIAVVESYRDTRIKYINFANKGVIAASRNQGISATSAPFIAFLDSDDIWYPGKLEKCLKRIEDGYDLVCHGEKWVGPGDQRRDVYYGPEQRASFRNLLYEGNCISTSAVLVKRTLVDAAGYFSEDPAIITAEDYDFWLKLARAGARIGFLRELLGEYRIHGGNQSGAVLRNMKAVMQVVRNQFVANGSATLADRLRSRRREAIVYYGGARGLQDSGQHDDAWPYFFRALRRWPFVAKFYAAMLLNAIRRRLI